MVTCDLAALCVAAADPRRLAMFWSGLLGWAPPDEVGNGAVAVLPADDTGFALRFEPSLEPKHEQNRMHFDLTSRSPAHQEQTVATALGLGGRHCDVGQGPEDRHVVLADPEGNELCVIEAGNRFLAECGFVGALACDGSQEVGYFWSEALGWPLVWDQDQETAIRAPYGGPKITWGGPPLKEKVQPNRWHFELAPAVPGTGRAEVERLLTLGASLLAAGPGGGARGGADDRVWLADPDGNEFGVSLRTAPTTR